MSARWDLVRSGWMVTRTAFLGSNPADGGRHNVSMRLGYLACCVSLTVCGTTLSGCGPSISRERVSQVPSPDGGMVATLFETNGGATTSFGYEVELSPKEGSPGTLVAKLYGATRNEEAYGVNLKWASDSDLAIECLKLKGTPEVHDPVRLNGRTIQVNLRTGIEDQSAPSGGMSLNLHKSAERR